jgi:hypothetical protein
MSQYAGEGLRVTVIPGGFAIQVANEAGWQTIDTLRDQAEASAFLKAVAEEQAAFQELGILPAERGAL